MNETVLPLNHLQTAKKLDQLRILPAPLNRNLLQWRGGNDTLTASELGATPGVGQVGAGWQASYSYSLFFFRPLATLRLGALKSVRISQV